MTPPDLLARILAEAEASVAQAEANVEKYRNAARHWKMQHDKLKAEASA